MSGANLKGVILDFDSLAPEALDRQALFNLKQIDWQVYGTTQPEQTIARVANADIILTNKVVIDASVLKAAPQLKYIGVLATGTNNLDTLACEKRGIIVNNVAGYGAASVAQHTVMLMLMLTTSVNRYQKAIHQGEWSKSPFFCMLDYPVSTLANKHLVIVGYGELGQRVANLAHAFDMRVSVAQRLGQQQASTFSLAGEIHPRKPLDVLLPDADFVSLHCALTPETQTMINKERLAKMKPGAFLLNTARGDLIDEAALLAALQTQQIAGAGLDVVSQEPPPSDHALLTANLPNLIVTPHNAWSAKEARQRLLDIAVSHLQQFLHQTNQ